METFLDLYSKVGLAIDKTPLGPLLPAPKANGTFCARPVSTAEVAKWLRALLVGTSNSETYRSHSLKATVLIWCAKAGFDRETRAVYLAITVRPHLVRTLSTVGICRQGN